ncbi:MAG: PqiC family protein [Pseudomonadota bacterium]
MLARFSILLLALSLAACSSSRSMIPQTKIYVLDSDLIASTDKQNATKVMLSRISIADYLDSQNLMIRKQGNEVSFARYHQWAERLPSLIHRSLMASLNRTNDSVLFVDQCDACAQIAVHIDHFYPNYEGDVVLAGIFEVLSSTGHAQQSQPFLLKQTQTSDGYTASVALMIKLLDLLGGEIAEVLVTGD